MQYKCKLQEMKQYELYKILNHKKSHSDSANKTLLYKVLWTDKSINWEPAENLNDCRKKIVEYWDKQRIDQIPPIALKAWNRGNRQYIRDREKLLKKQHNNNNNNNNTSTTSTSPPQQDQSLPEQV